MKTTINITGMHCNSCEMLIKEALEDTDGVQEASVSETEGKAIISHDNSITRQQLKKVITEEGFGVE